MLGNMLPCLKNHWIKLLFLNGHIYILYQKVMTLIKPTVLKHLNLLKHSSLCFKSLI